MLVAAIDVGSALKMGWSTSTGLSGCGEPTILLDAIASAISADEPVAIGFEAPLWVPRRRPFPTMTANRGGIEAAMSRPWSAGAGCGAMAAGIANMAWIFDALFARMGALCATTCTSRFAQGDMQLLIWEAFVSGHLKAQSHAGDAELAVAAFVAGWPHLETAIRHEPSINLAAAAAAGAGHAIDFAELGNPGLVIAAQPRIVLADT
ncbi:hypothetical protein [Novosphingobium guangzhouense]|uniref:hypothetical protein n=1 Tax=Novosphingobium guangzhouense TaxID=1850347 RepID=UPI0011AF9D95|nr:hypothetical protein [Novosphingobium guangzhouense]